MKCECGADILPSDRRCSTCDRDPGFLNVRYACQEEEVRTLYDRVDIADTDATSRMCKDVYNTFIEECKKTKMVVARSLSVIDDILRSNRYFIVSFHKQIRSGSRIEENNVWDTNRVAAEQAVNPFCFDDIIHGALSLDGRGVSAYGRYSLVLKETAIAHRAVVFEENPFIFNRRHNISAGEGCPPGFRAVWESRHLLAAAKLYSDITPETRATEFPRMLIKQGSSTGSAEFIEVHLLGRIHRSAIECVVAEKPISRPDKPIWKRLKGALTALDIAVEEV